MQYLVVLEHGATTWGAHLPDLPGCIAAAPTRTDVLRLVREAIAMHLAELPRAGDPVPRPASEGAVVEIDAA